MTVEVIDFGILLTWQFYVIAAACGALGEIVKKIPGVPDWSIPIINAVFGVAMMLLLVGLDPMCVIAGILSASVATYVYELFKEVVRAAKSAAAEGGKED